MIVSVDRVGRIVIPKQLRDALGIGAQTELSLVADGAGLRLEPVARRERIVELRNGLPILGIVEGTVLTDDDVRAVRDDLQR